MANEVYLHYSAHIIHINIKKLALTFIGPCGTVVTVLVQFIILSVFVRPCSSSKSLLVGPKLNCKINVDDICIIFVTLALTNESECD